MPPKIPESLQAQRIQKPLTVAQRQQAMIASSPEAQQKAYEERLKQAEIYQQQLYADEVVQKQRTYYVPRDYLDSRGNPTKAWFNLSAEKKQQLSDRVVRDSGSKLDRNLRKGYIGAYTETYSETTPFSLALYEQRYEKLPEDTKGLFYTRQQIEQKQQESKASVKTQYENRLKELQAELQKEKDRFNERLAKYKAKLDDPRYRKDRDKIKDDIDELEEDYEKRFDRVNYEIRGLQEGFNKFWDKGATFNDLNSYSRAYRRYEEARDRQREQAKQALKDYKLQNPDFVIKPNVSPITQLKQLQQGKSGVNVGISEAALKAMKLTPEEYASKMGTQVKVFKSSQQALDRVGNISFSRPSMEIKPSSQNNVLTYTAAPQPQGFLAKSEAYLKRKSYNQGWYSPLVGAGLSVVGFGTATKKVFTQSPVKTTQEFVGGTKEIIRRVSPSGEGFPEASQYLQQKPGESIGFIGAEILTGAGTGRLAKTVSTGAEFTFTRFSPKYVPTTPEGILLKETTIKSAGPLSEISVPIKQQAKVIGKPVTAVSAQRDLFGLFEKEKVIRKPIPGEEKLSQATKLELQRFDEGLLSPTEIESLNLKIIKETGSKGLLERSFFADPFGRVRYSRLGVGDMKEAGIIDYLSGDVTFKRAKPQIVYIKDTVADLPIGLKTKLQKGIPLDLNEQQLLRRIQLEKTGQLKPIGFLSTEPELTIAPGEVLRKKQVSGVTLIQGRRVKIIEAEIAKAKKAERQLFRRGGQRQFSFTSEIDESTMASKKYVSPTRGSLSLTSFGLSSEEPSSPIQTKQSVSPIYFQSPDYGGSIYTSSAITSPISYSPETVSPSFTSPSQGYTSTGISSPPTPTPPSPLSPTPGSPSPVSPILEKPIPEKPYSFYFPDEKKKRKGEARPYDAQVYIDATKGRKARWQTVADNVPLVTALSKGGQFVDESASNRFRVVPQKGKLNRIVDTTWNALQNKFREYTSKSGIKVGLKPRNYIEKRQFRIDSPGERRAIPLKGQATIARRFGR